MKRLNSLNKLLRKAFKLRKHPHIKVTPRISLATLHAMHVANKKKLVAKANLNLTLRKASEKKRGTHKR